MTGNDKSFVTYLTCHVGKRAGNRINKAKQGAFHSTNRIILEDTERDRLAHKDRVVLSGECGFNQKGFDFFLKDTFVSIKDIQDLVDWPQYKKKLEKQKNTIRHEFRHLESVIEFLDDPEKKVKKTLENKLKKNTDDSGNIPSNRIVKSKNFDFKAKVETNKYFAGVTKIRTKLKIRNILPVYDANVIVHLCRTRNTFNIAEPETLFKYVTNDRESIFGEGIRPDRLYSADLLDSMDRDFTFKAHMNTALETDLKNIENFKNSTAIVKSWARKLPEHSQWHIDITEHLGDGIYINNLLNFDIHKKQVNNIPINYFFIIEYFGDKRASVTRNKDQDTFSGYSPVKISYRFSQEISYVMNQDNPDVPIVLTYPVDDGAFESEKLAEDFYPTRKSKFNVDYENIKIEGSSKNKKSKEPEFTLDLGTDVVSTSLLTSLSKSLEDLGVDKDILDSLSEDDLPFSNSTDFNFEPHHDPPKGTDDTGSGFDEEEEDTDSGGLRNVQR